MAELSDILLKNLSDEDPYTEIENSDNPILFRFKKQDYIIHLTYIHSWTQRPHMRRIQIKDSLKNKLIKLHRYYIFGIFGYDPLTDTFTHWTSNYLASTFSSKSLYTYEEYLDSAVSNGISQHINKDDSSLSSVHFLSKYLSLYLSKIQTHKILINNEDYEILGLDHYHTKVGFSKIHKKIDKFHSLSFISNGKINKRNDKSNLINVRDFEDQDPNKKIKLNLNGLDDEEIRHKQEKANSSHIDTLNILANYLRNLGFRPLEDLQTFDLMAYDNSDTFLFEVKSITKKNFRTQVRHALIQLDEYVFKHKQYKTPGFHQKITKTIVFNDNPYFHGEKDKIDFYLSFIKNSSVNIMFIHKDRNGKKLIRKLN